MNKKLISSLVLGSILASSIYVASFGAEIPGSSNPDHWAMTYLESLEKQYNIKTLIDAARLGEIISVKEFNSLLAKIIGSGQQLELKTTTRQEVAHNLVLIWAQKTNTNLDELVQPMILLYQDEDQIDEQFLWNVRNANFIGLAKGRGNGYFSPKEELTYGEAVVMLSRLDELIEQHEKDKGVKEEMDSVNTSLQTIAAYEKQGDKITFDFSLTNRDKEPKELTFGSGQQYEITIIDQEGQEVYRYSDDKFFTMALINKTLLPTESIIWQEEWDLTDKEGRPLKKGSYEVIIEVLAQTEAEIQEAALNSILQLTID